MLGFYAIIGVITLFSWLVSNTLQRKFKKYSRIHLRNRMSGAEIAEKMLADHGIFNVKVISTPGRLTDHYNPVNRTVNLSEAVYNERNAAAAAVAAHEVGHAVQHAQAYQWLQMRSKLVPIVSISSRFSQYMVIGGIILGAGAGQPGIGQLIAVAGLIFMALGTLFSFITLPVEYDASNRALAWLENKHIVTREELAGSKDALKWAARTYLVAALGSLAMLLYWALRVLGNRD
ncbi:MULTISPECIES: zinc metallopeptidase [unclassified Tenacibaculum]|uniref:zinc metallopeptidase n=1 Tax=unclassified Tenacibaculum TaxID=2635139 RepID=UPI001F317002|nr:MULTISPECIES: zinc metallopeptidase [unclassified Tenacibaculum]MCF2873779.1 zinc metallopeptidase [Tenacibaculum sp. Cn5-1]MCF2933935.1 zinc metallopeptidase [Tenacibaculum sp. Cn5-34]MCG7509483.1 zinc metallopeptidase [Tenacibaculum sp. Cn5-46]